MLKLHVITASTRPGRLGPSVARWFLDHAIRDARFEIRAVDLAEINLPMFDEPNHPRFKRYEHDHTKAWSALVAEADAFVLVTPEYNFSVPPSLLNAIDYLYQEWNYKPVSFVSYGGAAGGTRSVQMVKLTLTALKMMPLPDAVAIPLFTKQIDAQGVFTPTEGQTKAATEMLGELARWAEALKTLRATK